MDLLFEKVQQDAAPVRKQVHLTRAAMTQPCGSREAGYNKFVTSVTIIGGLHLTAITSQATFSNLPPIFMAFIRS